LGQFFALLDLELEVALFGHGQLEGLVRQLCNHNLSDCESAILGCCIRDFELMVNSLDLLIAETSDEVEIVDEDITHVDDLDVA